MPMKFDLTGETKDGSNQVRSAEPSREGAPCLAGFARHGSVEFDPASGRAHPFPQGPGILSYDGARQERTGPAAISKLESPMNAVQIEQKSYEMPPREGISIAHFLTVADVERSARYYEKVFGARILTMGDGNAPPYLELANIWMILNVGGGPTPDKPTVTLSVPDPNHINSFMNFRVADIQACYELWKSRGAEFITEPIPKYGEIRCYIRDPDGYIIEVGQSTDLTYG
jgi:catechol 2,3-dioxygenase-like lactoylglutathione lyase family enzyme